MTKFDIVGDRFHDLPYMAPKQATVLRAIIEASGARDVLEIGFYQGKSSAYIAAILEDAGEDGHLTTFDLTAAKRHDPNIEAVLQDLDLSHRVSVNYCHRSYTWDLQDLISAPEPPQFDLCYFDGGHTWDMTGFGVVLVDMLLRPGGLLILDDMDWTIAGSAFYRQRPERAAVFDENEQNAKPVRLVWNTILPHLGYTHVREYPELRWGLARKPG